LVQVSHPVPYYLYIVTMAIPSYTASVPQTVAGSIPTTLLPSHYNYGAAVPQSYAYVSEAKPLIPGASRDLLNGGYVYERQEEPEQFFSKKAGKGGGCSDLMVALGVFLIPIIYFAIVYYFLAFQPRFYVPFIAWFVVLLLACAIIAVGYASFMMFMKDKVSLAVWSFALVIGLLVAFIMAVHFASQNYTDITEPLYARRGLNTYSNVDPASMAGTSFMDSGTLQFTSGAHVDNSKAGAFMNLDMYCVAPIVSKSGATPASYDFWAVGLNCCTGNNDFQCGDFREQGNSAAGLRLMSNSQQEFYKLAVSKTAASHNINAAHPLFFQFVSDATSGISAIEKLAWSNFSSHMLHIEVFQLFLTVTAAIASLWFTSRVK